MPPPLVLGTHNRKKGLELAELVAPWGIIVRTLADFPQAMVVVEDGNSFAANARLKAVQQAKHLDAWVLGEDSGLLVDAPGGGPASSRRAIPAPVPPMRRTTRDCSPSLATHPWRDARRITFVMRCLPIRPVKQSPRPREIVTAASCSSRAARPVSATTPCSRSRNTIARSPNWGQP